MKDPDSSGRSAVRVLVGFTVIAILVAAGLLVTDWVSRARVVQAISEDVGSELDVAVHVEMPGRGAGLAAVAGRIETLGLSALAVPLPDVEPAGISITRLEATLVDLTLQDRVPVSGRGTFTASFDIEEIRRAVPPALAESLSVQGDALVVDAGIAEIPLGVIVEDQALRFQPPAEFAFLADLLGESITVPMDVPDGVVVDDAAFVDSLLVLTGTLDPVVLSSAMRGAEMEGE